MRISILTWERKKFSTVRTYSRKESNKKEKKGRKRKKHTVSACSGASTAGFGEGEPRKTTEVAFLGRADGKEPHSGNSWSSRLEFTRQEPHAWDAGRGSGGLQWAGRDQACSKSTAGTYKMGTERGLKARALDSWFCCLPAPCVAQKQNH